MDGKLLNTMPVETKPSGLVYFDPYSEEQMRLLLPEGDHVFRAGFIGRRFRQGLTPKDALQPQEEQVPGFDRLRRTLSSPRRSRPAARRILICDPNSGPACVEKIVANLAHHAYRRPVTKAEVASLMKFVGIAQGPRPDRRSRASNWRSQAMLVSPHFLFRIEHDPNPPTPPPSTRISDVELASRLSYFLWSSMPDDELLALAEAGKLRAPACWMRR